jgi:hypothetical protein
MKIWDSLLTLTPALFASLTARLRFARLQRRLCCGEKW